MRRAARLKERETARKARITHGEVMEMRRRVELRLERYNHHALKLRKSRATIGQPFEHARKAEVLVSYRYGAPVYLPLERVVEITEDMGLLKKNTEYIFTVLAGEAKRYSKVRPAVRHRVWQEPAKKAVKKEEVAGKRNHAAAYAVA